MLNGVHPHPHLLCTCPPTPWQGVSVSLQALRSLSDGSAAEAVLGPALRVEHAGVASSDFVSDATAWSLFEGQQAEKWEVVQSDEHPGRRWIQR